MTRRSRGSTRRNTGRLPASTPLYHGQLEHSVSLPVLGIPVEFSSNSMAAMEAVEQSFGMWRRMVKRSPVSRVRRGVRVSIIQQEGGERSAPPVPVSWRMPDERRIIGTTPGSLGVADFDRGDVVIYATPDFLADRHHFSYSFLEALTLTTVNSCDRSPIHCGGLARGNAVLLLIGPSGTGKSTLVCAGMKAGMKVLADDAVYVQLHPRLAFWGIPVRIYLLPDARTSSLGTQPGLAAVLATGATKTVITTPSDRRAPVPLITDRVGAVILERSPGRRADTARLRPVPAATVVEALTADLAIPLAQFGDSMREAIRRVGRHPAWRLTLSPDPADAVPLLHDVFDQLDRAPKVAAAVRER